MSNFLFETSLGDEFEETRNIEDIVTGRSLLALVKAKGTETLRLGACSYQSTFLNQS